MRHIPQWRNYEIMESICFKMQQQGRHTILFPFPKRKKRKQNRGTGGVINSNFLTHLGKCKTLSLKHHFLSFDVRPPGLNRTDTLQWDTGSFVTQGLVPKAPGNCSPCFTEFELYIHYLLLGMHASAAETWSLKRSPVDRPLLDITLSNCTPVMASQESLGYGS